MDIHVQTEGHNSTSCCRWLEVRSISCGLRSAPPLQCTQHGRQRWQRQRPRPRGFLTKQSYGRRRWSSAGGSQLHERPLGCSERPHRGNPQRAYKISKCGFHMFSYVFMRSHWLSFPFGCHFVLLWQIWAHTELDT